MKKRKMNVLENLYNVDAKKKKRRQCARWTADNPNFKDRSMNRIKAGIWHHEISQNEA